MIGLLFVCLAPIVVGVGAVLVASVFATRARRRRDAAWEREWAKDTRQYYGGYEDAFTADYEPYDSSD